MTGELPRVKVRVVLRLARSLTKPNTSIFILRKDTRTPSSILTEEVLVKIIVHSAFLRFLPSMQSSRFHSADNTQQLWQSFAPIQMLAFKA
jgi:hypothetical protein